MQIADMMLELMRIRELVEGLVVFIDIWTPFMRSTPASPRQLFCTQLHLFVLAEDITENGIVALHPQNTALC
jgi:hypothetical protein